MGVGFGFVISEIGIFTVPASVLVSIFLLRRPRLRGSAYGALVGVGSVLLLIAYLNREGPGTVCHRSPGEVECSYDLPDPKKWAFVGLAFVAAGLLAQMFAAGPRASRA